MDGRLDARFGKSQMVLLQRTNALCHRALQSLNRDVFQRLHCDTVEWRAGRWAAAATNHDGWQRSQGGAVL